MNAEQHIAACDHYLGERTGCYEWRRERYMAALGVLGELGLDAEHTVCDVGAGWTEFDVCLRVDGCSRARYWPVDGCLDGTDLETWVPPRRADFFVCLELLEHLENPARLVVAMQARCNRGIVVSTPNPETTDVLGMDRTHKTPVTESQLHLLGFQAVETRSFYGQPADSIFAVWHRAWPLELTSMPEEARLVSKEVA